jgi:hypothetical protein
MHGGRAPESQICWKNEKETDKSVTRKHTSPSNDSLTVKLEENEGLLEIVAIDRGLEFNARYEIGALRLGWR